MYVLVNMLLVQHGGDKCAVGCQHEAAHLGEDGDILHAGGHQNLLKLLAHTLADGGNVVAALVGAVGNTDAPERLMNLIFAPVRLCRRTASSNRIPASFG